MKQTLLSLLIMLLPLLAHAEAVEIDGIYYNLIAKVKTAEVTTNPNGYKGNVVIPSSVVYNDVTYSVTSIGESAFKSCSELTSITIPNSVTSIGNYAFGYCSSLTAVHITDLEAWCKIEYGDFAYTNAHHLYLNGKEVKDLVIPSSVTSIGNRAFWGCSGLTSVTIPNSVTSIGDKAFVGCTGLSSVTIPNSVTSIGDAAFGGCSGLTSVTIPNSVTSIGESAFKSCSGLISVTIPNSVTAIEGSAFSGCSGLTSVTIPNSVTAIEGSAFSGCTSLIFVAIPNSVTAIKGNSFSGCTSLTSVAIPNSVTSIGNSAFAGCSGLTSVTVGSGVKKIDKQAFANCPELADVYCYAENVPNTNSEAFDGSYIEFATLHVPASAVNAYKNTEPWSKFKKIEGTGYTLTYMVDGTKYKEYSVREGDLITPEPAPKKEGYTFSGWSGIPSTMPANDVIVMGTFTENRNAVFTKSLSVVISDAKFIVADSHYTTGQTKLQEAIRKAEGRIATMADNDEVRQTLIILQAAIDEFVYANGHADVTGMIQNPSFDIEANNSTTITGWTTKNMKQNRRSVSYATTRSSEDSDVVYAITNFVEQWSNTSVGNINGSGEISQVIKGLPAGHYRLTADVLAINQRTEGVTEDATGIELYANDVVREIGMTDNGRGNSAVAFSVDFDVKEGKEPTIGFRFKDTNVNWLGIDNMTLYYISGLNTNTYKLTYLVDGQTYKTISYQYGASITPEPAPTKDGYTFSGWSSIPGTMPANDVTVTGTFTKNAATTYTLTYMVDGVVYKTFYYEAGATVARVEAPTKEGYTFSGWSNTLLTMPERNVTITGTFTKNVTPTPTPTPTYTLTYMVNGEVYKTVSYEYGEKITPEPEPTKEGATFSGWSWIPSKMPDEDVVVTGTFDMEKYKLTYKVDGADYKILEVEVGAAITPEPEPTKDGYTFSGWSWIPKKMPDEDVTITGTFTPTTGVETVIGYGRPFDVYTVTGRKVRSQVTSLKGLKKGVYIVEGKKVVVK